MVAVFFTGVLKVHVLHSNHSDVFCMLCVMHTDRMHPKEVKTTNKTHVQWDHGVFTKTDWYGNIGTKRESVYQKKLVEIMLVLFNKEAMRPEEAE